jgi:peroxiredoxin
MYTRQAALVISFVLLSFFLQAVSAELKLPGKVKQTSTTSADKLGTNENNLGLQVGKTVPEFESHTFAGVPVTLNHLLRKGPIMVIFYRGGWCPYCNYQVRQVTQAYDKFQQRNVTPVLISVDRTEGSTLLKQSYDIPFPVLSDPDLAAHEAFNAVIDMGEAGYEKYKNFGIDLETWSGQDHHKIAAPAIYLVAKDGKILWSHVAVDFKTRPDIDQLLSVIDAKLN